MLTPVAVAVVLGPFEDGVEFRDEAHEAGVFELAVKVRGQGVGCVQRGVEGGGEVGGGEGEEGGDRVGVAAGWGMVKEPGEGCVEGGRIGAAEEVEGFGLGGFEGGGGGVEGAKGEEEGAEEVEILGLVGGDGSAGGGLALHDVEDGAGGEADAVLGGEDCFGGVEDSGGEAGVVDGFEGVADLGDVVPERGFGDLGCVVAVRVAVLLGKVFLGEAFGERVIIGHEEKGGIAEAGVGECKMDGYYVGVADPFPILGNGLDVVVRLVCGDEAWRICGEPVSLPMVVDTASLPSSRLKQYTRPSWLETAL